MTHSATQETVMRLNSHPDGSPCFCTGRVLPPPDRRFVPGPMCPTSLARSCVCGIAGRDPERCDFHRKRPAPKGAR